MVPTKRWGSLSNSGRRMLNFTRYIRYQIREYAEFIRVIEEFRKFFGLGEFSRRQIDKFLWIEAQAETPDKPELQA